MTERILRKKRRPSSTLRQRAAQLEAELADSRLLQGISSEIVQQDDIDILYRKIMDGAVALMRSDCASMQILHPERGDGELRLLACHGFEPETARFWEWVRADSRCTCGEALRTGRRVIVPDVESCEFMAGTADLETSLRNGIRAVQTTPLYSRGGRMVGMISTHWGRPYQPPERSLRLLDILARQAADLIERRQTEDALRGSETRYRNIFENAGVSIWEEDFSAVKRELDGLKAAGIRDFRRYFEEHPEFVRRAIDSVRVVDVNRATLRMFGANDKRELLGSLERIFLRETAPIFTDELLAIAEERSSFEADATLRTVRGERLHALVTINFPPPGDGFERVLVTLTDITARKLLEEKTRHLAQRLQLVTDAMPALISYIDADRRYRFNNKTYQDWFGYAPEEIFGKSVEEVVGAAAYERVRPCIETALAGQRVRFEDEISYKKVGKRNIIAEYVPDIRPDGSVAGFYGLIHDITGRKRLEEKTQHLAQRLQLIADAMPALISYIDSGLKYRFNNRAYQDWFGYEPAEILGKSMREVLGEAAYERLRPHIEAALAGRPVRFEGEIPYKEGGTRNILGEYVPDIRADGAVAGFYVLIQDITERKRAELALKYHADEIESLLRAAPLGVYLVDADFKIRELNPVARPVFGDIPGGVVGRDFDEIIRILWEEKYADEVAGIFRHTLETGEPYVAKERAEYRIDRKVTEYYEWRVDRITLPDGRYGVVCYFRDISEQVQARKEIEHSRDVLREADRRKDEFLATLSHELRNPLAPIRQAATLLKMPGIGEREAHWARDVIDRQVSAMGWLLDDLLDLSRISRGKLELRKQAVTLGDVVESALELARPLIESRQHALHIELPEQGLRFKADPLRLAQIISNLLTNAAKYTDRGGEIRLWAGQRERELLIRVSDNGIGIDSDMLPRVFDMFSQATPALERTEGGLGVGLALVRGFVELHGGSVHAHSQGRGLGSAFTVRLPLGAVPVAGPEKAPPASADGPAPRLRVLVVDDNRDTAETLASLIRLHGYEVRAAYNGRDALETAEGFHPDIALLDIGMPLMNGYEIAQHIRKRPWGTRVTLVAVTGWGQEDDRRRAMAAGFDFHLRKPIDPEFLQSLLRERPLPAAPANG